LLKVYRMHILAKSIEIDYWGNYGQI